MVLVTGRILVTDYQFAMKQEVQIIGVFAAHWRRLQIYLVGLRTKRGARVTVM